MSGNGADGVTRRRYLKAAATAGAGAVTATIGAGRARAVGGDIQWSFDTGASGAVYSSPTVVDGTVFVGADDGNLYAIEAETGEKRWHFTTGDSVRSSPTVVSDTAIFASGDDYLYAVDATTGEQQWRFKAVFDSNAKIHSSPAVVDGTVYVGATNSYVYAVDAASGTDRWAFRTDGAVTSSPTVRDGRLYIGSTDGFVYAIDTETGEEVWRYGTDGAVWSSPTVADGSVYVGSHDERLHAIDAATGDGRWRVSTGNAVFASPTVADDTVVVGSKDSSLYAVETATGEQRWTFDVLRQFVSSPTIVEDIVYVGSIDSSVYAIELASGRKLWETDTGHTVPSSPTVSGGTLYVGNWAGRVYAIDTDIGGSSEGSRAMLGTLGHPSTWQYTGQEITVETATPTATASLSATDRTTRRSDANGSGTAGSSGATTTASTTADSDTPVLPIGLGLLTSVGGIAAWRYRRGGDSQSQSVAAPSSSEPGTDGNDRSDGEDTTASGASNAVPDQDVYEDIQSTLETAEAARDRRQYDQALSACESALETVETARERAAGDDGEPPERLDAYETEATDLRRDILTEQRVVADVSQTLDAIEDRFEEVTAALTEGSPKIAAEHLGGIATRLENVSTTIDEHDVSEASARLDRLRERYAELSERVESRFNTSATAGSADGSRDSGTTAARPADIPTTQSRDLSYEQFEDRTPIGKGGNADVYRATVTTPDGETTIAIKEPRMQGTLHTETVERLLREAETWDNLDDHDHIVDLIDYGSEPIPWIAMEYMDAGHLGERVGELSVPQALWTAVAVTNAVNHAHHRGVAHLDLKPTNVLFRPVEGSWDPPKVADWGLSKHLLDHSQSIEGYSPQYAAPEQFDDAYGEPDHQTDVYQLGAVFYELFTGEPVFEGQTGRVISKVLNEDPVVPSERADLPAALDEILLESLAKEQADRYESVLYLRDDLEDVFERL